MPKHLHEVAPASTEHEEITGVRIALQRLLHLQGEAVHATAHVGMARRDPHPHARGNGNHRRGSAFIAAAARSGSTAPEIRRRTPRPNSSSISGMPTGAGRYRWFARLGSRDRNRREAYGRRCRRRKTRLAILFAPAKEHASTDVMPTRNPVDRLSVDKGLGHQRPLLVLAPAPPRLT